MATEYHPLVQRYIDKIQGSAFRDQLANVNKFDQQHTACLTGLINALEKDVIAHLENVENGKQTLDINAVRRMFQIPLPNSDPKNDRRAQHNQRKNLQQSHDAMFSLITNLTYEEDIVDRMDLTAKRRDLRYRFYTTLTVGLVIMALYLGAFVIGKYTETFKGFQPPLSRGITNPTSLANPASAVRLNAAESDPEPVHEVEPEKIKQPDSNAPNSQSEPDDNQ